jgi:EAL domain-containing protein (putative c-di-GMP-specific phosphodiesterase class I)
MKGGANDGATLAALHRMGVKLTIEAFGIGYLRLICLQHHQIYKLKIARAFTSIVTDAQGDEDSIIAAIIAVAKSMKIKVIAEGVETPAQRDFLRQYGCDEYQGLCVSASDLTEPD